MRTLFVDTAYIYAIINPRDQWRSVAVEWREVVKKDGYRLLTSEFVLAEVANGLAAVGYRQAAYSAISVLGNDPTVTIVESSTDLFKRSMELYASRSDKGWGFTDCSSFVLMNDYKVTDALTTDDHFRQAGFKILLIH